MRSSKSPKFLLAVTSKPERIKGSSYLMSTDRVHVRAQKPFHFHSLQGSTWARDDRINHASAEKFSASIIVANENSRLAYRDGSRRMSGRDDAARTSAQFGIRPPGARLSLRAPRS